jgi:ligand-binding SRPBCC domain-containing protein
VIAIVVATVTGIMVLIQLMYPKLPKYIGWPVVGVLLIVLIVVLMPSHTSRLTTGSMIAADVVIFAVVGYLSWKNRSKSKTQQSKASTKPYSEEWEHMHRLIGLMLEVEKTPQENLGEIKYKMQTEQNALCDKNLDEMMTTYYHYLEEAENVGLNQNSIMTNAILEKIRDYAGKKYKPKR